MNIYDPKNYGPIRDYIILKYVDELTKFKETIERSKGDIAYIKLIDLYEYAKMISPFFVFEDDPIRSNFAGISSFVEHIEWNLPNDFLLYPSLPDFKRMEVSPSSEPEEILEYIAMAIRLRLSHAVGTKENIKDFEKSNLTGECLDAAFLASDLAASLGFIAKVRIIEPGYLINSQLYMKNGGDHAFTIVSMGNRKFLIDLTYSQFFLVKRCLIEKIGLMRVRNTLAGYFMVNDRERQKVAEKILKDGWIELKGNVLKHYLDGFTLSYRNGLYYENTQDFSFTTPYTESDYWSFLSHEDDMLNHEPEETLGYQYRPLKGPRMKLHN